MLYPRVVLLSLLGLGCATQPGPPLANAKLDAAAATALCLRLHEEGAKCADAFNALLIGLRAEHDPRFAKLLEDPTLRGQIFDEGRAEILDDGTGPLVERRQTCAGYAEEGPPVPASDGPALERCYTLATCEERVACMRPVLAARFAERPSAR